VSIATARARRSRFEPSAGATVSVTTVRIVVGVVLAGLCFSVLRTPLQLAIGLVLAAASLAFPKIPAAWGLAFLLAVSALGSFHVAPDWRFFVVLAGAHALHLFGLMLIWLPAGGRIQRRLLVRMLRSYLIVQLPTQLVAFVLLSVLSGNSVTAALTSPFFGLLAALALVCLVVVVLVPVVRGARDD
jgi:hypothetical protein